MEDDDEYSQEEEEYTDEEDEVEDAARGWLYQPCRWCDLNNGTEFVCPNPQIAPGFNHVPEEHLHCRHCGIIFPDRGTLEEECASCGGPSCHYMNPACTESELKPFTGLIPALSPANSLSRPPVC